MGNSMFETRVQVKGKFIGGEIVGDVFVINRVGHNTLFLLPNIKQTVLMTDDIDSCIDELMRIKEKIDKTSAL